MSTSPSTTESKHRWPVASLRDKGSLSRAAGWAAAAILTLACALHLYWALGGEWAAATAYGSTRSPAAWHRRRRRRSHRRFGRRHPGADRRLAGTAARVAAPLEPLGAGFRVRVRQRQQRPGAGGQLRARVARVLLWAAAACCRDPLRRDRPLADSRRSQGATLNGAAAVFMYPRRRGAIESLR